LARAAFTLAAALAVFVQAFVVQTHIHAFVPLAPSYQHAAGIDPGVHAQPSARGEERSACALCAALAASGRAVLASGPLVGVLASAAFAVASPEPPLAPYSLSHSWQSRAPPTHL
jgi:hypothetical protein